MNSEPRYKIIRVTLTEDYLVEMNTDTRTQLGYDLDKLTKEWFEDFSINVHHASRESHRIGGGRKVLNYEVLK